jgi:hypothetical protein
VNHVEVAADVSAHFQRITLDELEWVVFLWPMIDPNDAETGAAVADCCPACAGEQIQ